MHRLLDRGLEELTKKIFQMGEVAEKIVSTSFSSYLTGKRNSDQVFELSEMLVSMTSEIEEKAFGLIAKYQPVASDLRIISSYIKVAYDFERYGRYSWDIAFVGKRLGAMKECDPWIVNHVGEMSEKVLDMVKISVEALKRHDIDLAKSLSSKEQEVDKMYFYFLDKLVSEAQTTNRCTISSVLVVRYLERIADHATYVAESIVYVASGEKVIIR
jgi:phosphate transport system protein